MVNISEESKEVFTWQRHAKDTLENAENYVHKLTRTGYLSNFIVGHLGFLEGKTVCDAGCGGGLKSCALASLNPKHVIGIDISEPGLESARALAQRLKLDNIEFEHGYLEDIVHIINSKGFESIDFIFNSFNIHHVEDWRKQIHDFSSLLKPGGILYINWVTLGRNWGSFLVKNRISFALGNKKESRLKIGKRLFGLWDKRHNKMNIEWDSFFADRYSAFYRIITVGQMKRELRRAGFEIVQTDPPLDILEFCLLSPLTRKRSKVAKMLKKAPFLIPFMTLLLRTKQFISGGDIRALICIKTSRPSQQP